MISTVGTQGKGEGKVQGSVVACIAISREFCHAYFGRNTHIDRWMMGADSSGYQEWRCGGTWAGMCCSGDAFTTGDMMLLALSRQPVVRVVWSRLQHSRMV